MWVHCAYFFVFYADHQIYFCLHNLSYIEWVLFAITITKLLGQQHWHVFFYDIQMPRRHYLFKNRSLYILFHARIIWNWRLKFMLSCVKYSAGNINMFSPERPINLKKGKAHYSTQFTRLPTSSMRICWLDKKQVSDLSALTSVRIQRVSLKRFRL